MFDLNKKDLSPAPSDDKANQAGETEQMSARARAGSGDVAVIGRSIKIEGDLRGEEDLRIEGDVSGTIELPNHALTIGREGRVNADAYAKSVTVDGEINGDLYGSECVNIRADANVQGNVVATRVSLEEGARFKGSIDMDRESVEKALGKKQAAGAQATDPKRAVGATKVAATSVNSTDNGAAPRPAGGNGRDHEPAH